MFNGSSAYVQSGHFDILNVSRSLSELDAESDKLQEILTSSKVALLQCLADEDLSLRFYVFEKLS